MTDLDSLAVLAVAFYTVECFLWLRRGQVAFRRLPLARRHRPITPGFGNDRAGLVLANPFPPLGKTFVCGDWLLCISDDRVGCLPVWARPRSARAVRLDAVREVAQDSGRLYVNGGLLLDAGEQAPANHCAELIRRLARLPRTQRDRAIDLELSRATNATRVRRILKSFLQRSAWLRAFCHLLFVLVVVVLPLMAWQPELTAFWPQYLTLLFGSVTAALVLFLIHYRRLYPEAVALKWQHFMTLLLPTMTARAADQLSRPLLARFHPLAVAAVLSDPATFAALARRTLLDLRFPRDAGGIDAADRELEFGFRPRLAAALQAMLSREGLDIARLTAPPQREDPAIIAFCPRCDRQFVLSDGTCHECGGVSLVNFPPAIPSAAAPGVETSEP